jgi:hypothetical protein
MQSTVPSEADMSEVAVLGSKLGKATGQYVFKTDAGLFGHMHSESEKARVTAAFWAALDATVAGLAEGVDLAPARLVGRYQELLLALRLLKGWMEPLEGKQDDKSRYQSVEFLKLVIEAADKISQLPAH